MSSSTLRPETASEESALGFPSLGDLRHLVAAPAPRLRHQGIHWEGGIGGKPLQIALTFENPHPQTSVQSEARIEIAAFGAFVPGKPLTSVIVPPIPPGGKTTVTTSVPDEDLPAIDWPQTRRPGIRSLLRTFLRLGQLTDMNDARSESALQPFHLVGNLNVFVNDSEPVERHMQRAFGLARDLTNVACFCVGDGRRDSYVFSFDAEGAGWQVDLQGTRWNEPVRIDHFWFTLLIVPPPEATRGRLTVWVERQSTGRRVAVEFDLAVGAGPARCVQL